MKFYQEDNVFDAALKRIRWVFDEFPIVVANTSGGKDSTVVVNLALRVAEEKGRLPLKVMFLDQEAEWDCVIDYIRDLMTDPRVEPIWLQCPIKLFNATSGTEDWLQCWKPGEEWLREKESFSIHENTFGTDRFKEMFKAYFATTFAGQKAAYLTGVRCEESPSRARGLTLKSVYKGETWGTVLDKELPHITFSPIYDWSYTDVWKAIHENGWKYTKLYDYMYQYGIRVMDMRVSNVHHETAFKNLFFLQEIEPETWNKLTNRLAGVNTAGQLNKRYMCPKVLPAMFENWAEYRDHLVNNFAPEEHRDYYRKTFAAYDGRYMDAVRDRLVKTQIAVVLSGDYHGTKLAIFRAAHTKFLKNAGSRGGDPAVMALMRAKGDIAAIEQDRLRRAGNGDPD